jgi:hypothetical protein
MIWCFSGDYNNIIANFYMEHFEQQALSMAIKKPAKWYRYVGDTYMVWPHKKDELHEFLKHLNNIYLNVTFTMETEQDKTLPFLVRRRPDGSLGHSVYRKSTRTDLYLHAKSEHHLTKTSCTNHTSPMCQNAL